MRQITRSSEETIALGHKVGKCLSDNTIVCFFGDLAAGKTTLIKGIASGVAGYPQDQVNSPTFVYLNIYEGSKKLYHFDLYRLQGADEFLSMGFDEMLFAGGVTCIEWSERIESLLPPDSIRVEILHRGEDAREITISPWEGL